MVGVYTESFMADLGLSRSAVSSIWTATLIASALYVQGIGCAVDRVGAPWVMRAAVLPYLGAMLLLAQAQSVGALTAGYLLVRMLGPETLDFCSRNCLNQWWAQRRGWAFGVLNAAGALMVTLPSLTSQLKLAYGWRATLTCVGIRSWWKVPSTLSEDSAPSASLDSLKTQAAPTHPRAQPEQLGGLPWPQEPASGRPKIEDFPR